MIGIIMGIIIFILIILLMLVFLWRRRYRGKPDYGFAISYSRGDMMNSSGPTVVSNGNAHNLPPARDSPLGAKGQNKLKLQNVNPLFTAPVKNVEDDDMAGGAIGGKSFDSNCEKATNSYECIPPPVPPLRTNINQFDGKEPNKIQHGKSQIFKKAKNSSPNLKRYSSPGDSTENIYADIDDMLAQARKASQPLPPVPDNYSSIPRNTPALPCEEPLLSSMEDSFSQSRELPTPVPDQSHVMYDNTPRGVDIKYTGLSGSLPTTSFEEDEFIEIGKRSQAALNS